jgi:hypothetical protein
VKIWTSVRIAALHPAWFLRQVGRRVLGKGADRLLPRLLLKEEPVRGAVPGFLLSAEVGGLGGS